MADQISDVLQHLRQLLLADATFAATISDGAVYTAQPRTAVDTIPMPCVIFEVGPGRPFPAAVPGQQLSIDCYVFSRDSQGHAFSLYESARVLLNMARLYSGVTSNGDRVNKTNGYVEESARPEGGWHEAYSAWLAHGRYTAYTATGTT